MLKYICKICNQSFTTNIELKKHVAKIHGLNTIQEYYDKYIKKDGEDECIVCGTKTKFISINKGYTQYCSKECNLQHNKDITINNKLTDNKINIQCQVCKGHIEAYGNKELIDLLSLHIKEEHGIDSLKTYYDTYLKKENEGKCEFCGKETKFKSISHGYRRFCSSECIAKSMQKNSEGVSTHGDGLVASIKRFMQSAVETIKTKYKTFLKTDKKSNMFNTVGDAGFIHKNIASKEVVLTPDNDKVLVKTEISCSKERSPYLGSAQKYMPKVEFCNGNKTYNDEIIDDDFTLNETEWCH